jgi:GNAT superfamily N-acetyltransferase
MGFHRVDVDDTAGIECVCAIRNAAQRVDNPDELSFLPELEQGWLRYGWDLELPRVYLFTPDGTDLPVATLTLSLPEHDNLDLVWVGGDVHPDHRRAGHGTALMEFALDLTRQAGRHIVWVGSVAADAGARAFVERFGFRAACQDARRAQRLTEVDWDAIARLDLEAAVAAADYELVRALAPTPDDVLASLVEVTAAINDAPMGELSQEPEQFDVERLRDMETAAAGRGDTIHRVYARHRDSGQIAGHTLVCLNPVRTTDGEQADTSVAHAHRGHRLGLRLKIDMMRWLRDAAPRLAALRTWNNVDNAFMINVNETLGYRLQQTYTMYELTLPAA